MAGENNKIHIALCNSTFYCADFIDVACPNYILNAVSHVMIKIVGSPRDLAQSIANDQLNIQ